MEQDLFYACNELLVPEGKLGNDVDIIIPNNRHTWPIALAHAYRYMNNVFKTEIILLQVIF